MKIWFGGYTKTTSQGIYLSELQEERVTAPALRVKIENPTYFQIDHKQQLFSVMKDQDQGGVGLVNLFVNPGEIVATHLEVGAPPAYVGLNEAAQEIYLANYHEATLQVLSYADQKLTLVAETTHEGSGPLVEQQSAHPHYFDRTPTGELVSCDLGTDQVEFYQLEADKLVPVAIYQNQKGFGTRHLVFHPTHPEIMFVLGELSSSLNVVKRNDQTSFTDLGTYATVAETHEGHNGAAAILISPDGKYFYVSNRGEDTLVVFKINQTDFSLQLIQRISTEGSFPRDFNWDPSTKYVVAANQTTNNASLYQRNLETGFLTLLQKDIEVPEATRVLFTED